MCLTRIAARALLLALAFAGAIPCPGCSRSAAPSEELGPTTAVIGRGVTLRTWRAWRSAGRTTFVAVLDVDLAAPGTRVEIAVGPLAGRSGLVLGPAHTVNEWCRASGAAAGVNGGFFGVTDGPRKQVVGLVAAGGVVRNGGGLMRQRSGPFRYARSVLGFDRQGRPRIAWATGIRGSRGALTSWERPTNPAHGRSWTVVSALGCGPMLVSRGKAVITDRGERLVSDRRTGRTFVARVHGSRAGSRMLLCAASSMTYEDAAAFLQRYSSEFADGAVRDAMCLDGGSSTQMAAASAGRFTDVLPSAVTVPTAVLVYAGGR